MLKHAYGLRGLIAAIVVIVLSAGAAAAAGPSSHAASGLATAALKAGNTVPVAGQEATNEDEETDEVTEEPAETVTTNSEASDNCTTDPTTLDEAALAELTHGAIVCWAAHQETPAEFDNHGAWVKSWATKNHGEEASSSHGKPENPGKP